MDTVDTEVETAALKEHQVVVDRTIKKLKDTYIKELTEVSKYLKKKVRTEGKDNSKFTHNSNIVTIKLSYLYYLLDTLKSYKDTKQRTNHPLYTKSVSNAVNLVENKELKSFIKKVNKDLTSSLFSIPDGIKQDALKQVKCGVCNNTKLKEIASTYLIFKPVIPVICGVCGSETIIEFSKDKDS